jgi:NADP-dependent 3-hydroxy acid dehydrogenase YdfG
MEYGAIPRPYLDILVNNVGGSDAPNGGYKALSDDDWQKALNINLLASVRLDRAFLPGMIERKSGEVAPGSSCGSPKFWPTLKSMT